MMRRSVEFARIRAHAEFDKLWRSGTMSRGQAYQWLAKEFGRAEVHMAWMTCEECRLVVVLVRKLLRDLHVPPEAYKIEEGPRTPGEALKEFRRRTGQLTGEDLFPALADQADRINDDVPEDMGLWEYKEQGGGNG